MRTGKIPFLRPFVAGVALGSAFLVPETFGSLFLGILTSALFVYMARGERPAREFYLAGVVSHLLAFAWLPDTLSLFGGFPQWVSVLLFFLFALLSTLSFLICGVLIRRLRRSWLEPLGLVLPASWFVVEFLIPKLFPWQLAYTQIRWTSFAVLAEFSGAISLSAFLLWGVELGVRTFASLSHKKPLTRGECASLGVVVVVLLFGVVRVSTVEKSISASPEVKVGVVQGNLGVFEKRDRDSLIENLNQYRNLSKSAEAEGAELLIWPESVLNRPILEETPTLAGSPFCPLGADGEISLPTLYGGLSVRERAAEEVRRLEAQLGDGAELLQYRLFNTAFGVDSECRVVGRYHKRILMPFGEYMPFADLYPQIRALSPQTGSFDAGDLQAPIEFELAGRKVKASTLICYEDLVPALSQGFIGSFGGNLLVNITNDAWYGKTAAPYQHHLLALWRAIETRRYLIRATNTGYSGVVDPLGRTLRSLPTFEPGFFVAPVRLIEEMTVFVRLGNVHNWILLGIVALSLLRQRKEEGSKS